MRKIRVNTGLDFLWTLYLGENTVDWAYYDLTLEMTKPSHAKEIIDFTVEGSVLKFNYKPTQCGQYIISAYLNRYKPDETILDNKVFEAVRWSWNTTEENDNLAAVTLELEGNIEVVNSGPKIDISKYYTKEEVDAIVEGVVKVENLESYNFATEAWVTANYQVKGDYQPAGNYLTSIPSEYVTENELETRLEQIDIPAPDLSDYYTKSEVDDRIDNIDMPTVDLTGYATEAWTKSNFQGKGSYVTKKELDNKGYLTFIPSEYVTEQELDSKGYLTYIPSEYVTEQELNTKNYVTNDYLRSKNYVTQADLQFGDFNLDGYYTKYETDEKFVQKGEVNMDEYATKYQVALKQDNLVSGENIKTINGESILGKGDITFKQYDAKQDALVSGVNIKTINGIDILGKGDIIITGSDAPDMTGYVTTTELNNRGFITEIPDEYLTNDDISNVVADLTENINTKQDILVVGQNIKTINGKSILGGGNIQIDGGGSADLTGYATETWVENKGYVTSDYLADKGFLTEVPSEYVTETELETRLENVSGNVDLTGYATEAWVEDKGYLTEVPSEYVTESELETRLENVSGSADEIPALWIYSDDGSYNDRFLVQTIFDRMSKHKPCIIEVHERPTLENGLIAKHYSSIVNYEFHSGLSDGDTLILWIDGPDDTWFEVSLFNYAHEDDTHYHKAGITKRNKSIVSVEETIDTQVVKSPVVRNIVTMTQADYDSTIHMDNTLYIIVD